MNEGRKINDYIWHYENSDNNPYPLIYITIAPNTNKTITLLPPLVTLYDTPHRWVPLPAAGAFLPCSILGSADPSQ